MLQKDDITVKMMNEYFPVENMDPVQKTKIETGISVVVDLLNNTKDWRKTEEIIKLMPTIFRAVDKMYNC